MKKSKKEKGPLSVNRALYLKAQGIASRVDGSTPEEKMGQFAMIKGYRTFSKNPKRNQDIIQLVELFING